jgi:ABC-type Fe3+-hydroxamate transport system substrate-binding protein
VRQVRDARGRPVDLPDRVDRVVSLVPSLTEWLVHAGVGERLVGVTDWCAEPAEVVAVGGQPQAASLDPTRAPSGATVLGK